MYSRNWNYLGFKLLTIDSLKVDKIEHKSIVGIYINKSVNTNLIILDIRGEVIYRIIIIFGVFAKQNKPGNLVKLKS